MSCYRKGLLLALPQWGKKYLVWSNFYMEMTETVWLKRLVYIYVVLEEDGKDQLG
jgi:hypothetical protein